MNIHFRHSSKTNPYRVPAKSTVETIIQQTSYKAYYTLHPFLQFLYLLINQVTKSQCVCLSLSRKLFQRIMNSTCLRLRNAAIQHSKMDCESCESTNKDSIADSSTCYVANAVDNSLAGTFFSFVLGVLLTPVWLFPHFNNSFIPLLHYPNVFQIILQAILYSFWKKVGYQ